MTTTIVLLHGAALNGRMWDPGLAAGMTGRAPISPAL